MKKHLHSGSYIAIGILTITIAFFLVIRVTEKKYVTGLYSRFCYEEGHEDPRIIHHQYYPSLSSCGKPLHK